MNELINRSYIPFFSNSNFDWKLYLKFRPDLKKHWNSSFKAKLHYNTFGEIERINKIYQRGKMNKKLLIFHHIPRTGGTFVIESLVKSLEYSNLYPYSHCRVGFNDNINNIDSFIFTIKRDFAFISSHWAFNPKFFHKKNNEFYFTWKRDPERMFLSAWEYYRLNKNIAPNTIRLKNQVNLIRNCKNIKEYIQECENGKDFFPCGNVDDTKNKKFDFVGNCETMDEDIMKICNILQIKPILVNRIGNLTLKNKKDLKLNNRINKLISKRVLGGGN